MVKVYIVPLETLQINILQQVLRKLPVATLCRLRRTCKFCDSHVEEYKNMFSSRYFDPELDLLWSYFLSSPHLQYTGPGNRLIYPQGNVNEEAKVFAHLGKYKENVCLDSYLQKQVNWKYNFHVNLVPTLEDVKKLSAVCFGVVRVVRNVEDVLESSQSEMELLRRLNLHCKTLCVGKTTIANLKTLAELIHCQTISIALKEMWENDIEITELAATELSSKIHAEISIKMRPGEIFHATKSFKGFTIYGDANDFKGIIEDLYSTTENYNLENIHFLCHPNCNVTLDIPHETLWNRDVLPPKLQGTGIPSFIYLVLLRGKLATVSIYDLGWKEKRKELIVDIIDQSQETALNVLKKKLRLWDSRYDKEYLSADANQRSEILSKWFLTSRGY